MEIEVWSDIICPWCYIGNVRLKKAIEQLDEPASIVVRTRSFELDELAPSEPAPNLERLAAKYGVSIDGAMEMELRLAALAEEEGVPFVLERPSANSFDLHRIVWLAREFGVGEELFDRLQQLFFGQGANVFDHALLAAEAEAAGVPADRVAELLASDEYGDEVRADERQAREIGVTGVPFTVLSGKWAIPGAVETDLFHKAVKEISAEAE